MGENTENLQIGDEVMMLAKIGLPLAVVIGIKENPTKTELPFAVEIKYRKSGNTDRKGFKSMTKSKDKIALANIYRTILESGKADGEYSERDELILETIEHTLGTEVVRKIDKEVLNEEF